MPNLPARTTNDNANLVGLTVDQAYAAGFADADRNESAMARILPAMNALQAVVRDRVDGGDEMNPLGWDKLRCDVDELIAKATVCARRDPDSARTFVLIACSHLLARVTPDALAHPLIFNRVPQL